jgi:hypothetical protein
MMQNFGYPNKEKEEEEMKKLTVAIIAIGLIGASGLAQAQGWGMGQGRRSGYGFGGIGIGANCPAFSGAGWDQNASRYQRNVTPEEQSQFKQGNNAYSPGSRLRGGFGPGSRMGRGMDIWGNNSLMR